MQIRVSSVAAAAVFALWCIGAHAQQSPVSAYIEKAFGNLPQSNCNSSPQTICLVPVTVVVNTIHLSGDPTFNSPASGSVRYCSGLTRYFSGPIFGFVASGEQRRSESAPPFSAVESCELDFNLNFNTMKFIGPKVGNVAPSVTYNLQVLNGMLVGASSGFTAVVVFGTPAVTHP